VAATPRAVFVINPVSDHGGTGRAWPQIAAEARRRGLEVTERVTESAGHATVIVRDALAAGEELIVAVGGDGTVNEVANGFFDAAGAAIPTAARLGVIERGTGCDFIRTYGLPKKARDAIAVIAAGRTRRIDLGRTRFAVPTGEETRVFANIASCGMTGDVAERSNRTTKRFGGTASFLYATAAAFVSWQNVEFRVVLDGDRERTLLANNVVCANGRYFGGGIKIAPYAEPDDGLLDVVIIGDVGKLDLVLNLHRMYGGTLDRHPKCEMVKAATVTCEPVRPLPVEVDGEQPGTTPITFEIVPSAVDLIVP
jgi:YegS/Rv2252/BmrU family lipid kinase